MDLIPEIREGVLRKSIARARAQNIVLPTFAQQKNPTLAPDAIKDRLKDVGLWDLDPANLFRITWKNEPVAHGGGYGEGNWIEFPSALTGIDATVVGILGKWFPTGAHKVGAAYGCLVPQLVTGAFDPDTQKAVWPSTGNYCRGGAYDCALLSCPAVAILPEGMSRERFEWLAEIGTDEVIATPGTESNVKEIYDKCWELRDERGDGIVVFNQFEEFGNAIWHYQMTGSIVEDIFRNHYSEGRRLSGYVSATGSAGTIAAGDYLRTQHPDIRIVATEALQCPTLLQFGFGDHRIEGIGDKHVPWIHNTKNTDMLIAVDDEFPISLMRLFNEPAGKQYLVSKGVAEPLVNGLNLLGISCIGNLVGAIKFARYYELDEHDIVLTVLTDSMEMYDSRLHELTEERGQFTENDAAAAYARYLEGLTIDNMEELTYYGRKRIHNLKYYTWVEQQGKTYEEIQQQWYNDDYWESIPACVDKIDELIEGFNARTGLLNG